MSTEEQKSKWKEINAKRKDYRKKYWEQRPEKLAEHTKKWLNTHQEHHKEWRELWNTNNKRKLRTYLLTYNYGMTFQQVQEMYISQNGCCGICEIRFKSRRHIHIDHNHTTKKVRALLCHKCNVGLGYFNEDTSLLTKAIEYINKHSDITANYPD